MRNLLDKLLLEPVSPSPEYRGNFNKRCVPTKAISGQRLENPRHIQLLKLLLQLSLL